MAHWINQKMSPLCISEQIKRINICVYMNKIDEQWDGYMVSNNLSTKYL
jgi:hypothetical protein